jgi:hypothetical protein
MKISIAFIILAIILFILFTKGIIFCIDEECGRFSLKVNKGYSLDVKVKEKD